jgi:uncharacterized protein (DUF302 family)
VTAPGNGTNLLVSVPSRHDFEATLRRLREQMNARGATVFAEVDHRANAHTVKLEMPSTTVLLFGNPRSGTPPMLVAPELAYDLPLRVLVREDADGVRVEYRAVADLAALHGVAPELLASLRVVEAVVLGAAGPHES